MGSMKNEEIQSARSLDLPDYLRINEPAVHVQADGGHSDGGYG